MPPDPEPPKNPNPQLIVESTIVAPQLNLPQLTLLNIGDPNGVLGPPSSGPGDGFGIGPGNGHGVGPGDGPGAGPGGNGGISGIQGFRGNIVQPIAVFHPEPLYSDEARKVKHQGMVMIKLIVDEHGLPQNIVVTQGLGLGLDERAVEAVKKWRFRPGTQNGKPVAMPAIVQVTFRLL